jgi:hypothetical protein
MHDHWNEKIASCEAHQWLYILILYNSDIMHLGRGRFQIDPIRFYNYIKTF